MSAETLTAHASLVNQKVGLEVTSNLNPDKQIRMDYFPPLGDGEGYTGLELFLMSLAGCSSTSVIALLRRMRKDITGFKANLSGVRREQPPTSFEKIHLEFIVDSNDVTEADMVKVIKLSEDSICPVWAMIKNNVEVTTSFRINTLQI